MVSVSFPPDSEQVSAKQRLDKSNVEQKPSVIIDLLDEKDDGYKVIEQPAELVDIASDNEKENSDPGDKRQSPTTVLTQTPSKGPMTPPEPDRYDPFDPTVSPDNEPVSLPADPPPTPPLQPSTPPMETPSPTKFVSSSPNTTSSPGIKLTSSPQMPRSLGSDKKR